jgi:hypothetical protein
MFHFFEEMKQAIRCMGVEALLHQLLISAIDGYES